MRREGRVWKSGSRGAGRARAGDGAEEIGDRRSEPSPSSPPWKPAAETQTLPVSSESRFPPNDLHMTGFPREIGKFTVWNRGANAGERSHPVPLICI